VSSINGVAVVHVSPRDAGWWYIGYAGKTTRSGGCALVCRRPWTGADGKRYYHWGVPETKQLTGGKQQRILHRRRRRRHPDRRVAPKNSHPPATTTSACVHRPRCKRHPPTECDVGPQLRDRASRTSVEAMVNCVACRGHRAKGYYFFQTGVTS